MSSSDRLWGTPKQQAYNGWLFALIGGGCIGFGAAVILIPRVIMEGIMAINPTVVIVPESYANVQLLGAFIIMIGLLSCILGVYMISRSQRTLSHTQPSISTTEKKFCRYCGTENSEDAIFCEKCGKKILKV